MSQFPPAVCFLLERLPKARRELRCFTFSARDGSPSICNCPHNQNWGHDATVTLDEVPYPLDIDYRDSWPRAEDVAPLPVPYCNLVWPKACETGCGFGFETGPGVERQINCHRLYRDPRNGNEITLQEARKIPGAMWDASWFATSRGPDGKAFWVVCPGGDEWHIDGCASNCTWPGGDGLQEHHHCWVRTGVAPKLTVGKEGGPTCTAGAGSILTSNWHGFLVNGVLQEHQ